MGVYEVIAIDPDSVKSGVATLVVDSKSVKGESMSFPETISYVRSEFGRLRRESKDYSTIW